MSDVIKGLKYLAEYFDDDGYHISAEHDTIYVYPTDRPLPQAVVRWMIDLGWLQPDAEGDDDEFKAENYDPEESWAFYV